MKRNNTNIITRIRKSYITRGMALTMAFNMLVEFIYPTAAMALTTGPSQPEVQSFEPVQTSDMVNLFTGDFTYNIPLLNVPGPNGGYPINLAYHSGASMDQEASWVGLGWNINAGAINRSVRGLPDDFDGDKVTVTQDMKDMWTAGLGVSGQTEFFGLDNGNHQSGTALTFGITFKYNNYKGFGYSLDAGLKFNQHPPSYNVGLSLDPDDGVGLNASATLAGEWQDYKRTKYSAGLTFNSKRGLGFSTNLSVEERTRDVYQASYLGGKKLKYSESNSSYTEEESQKVNEGVQTVGNISVVRTANWGQKFKETAGGSAGFYLDAASHSPSIGLPMNNYFFNFSFGVGGSVAGVNPKAYWSGFFNTQTLKDKGKPVELEAYGYENMTNDMELGDFARNKDGNVMKTTSNLATTQLTYDYYQIQGQGIGGSFRPYRNESGRVFDPTVRSFTAGGYINLDGFYKKAGWGGGVTVGYSTQRAWDNNNGADDIIFTETYDLWENKTGNYKEKENVYYQSHGEKTTKHENEMAHIGNEDPVSPALFGNGVTGNYKTDLDAGILPERDATERIRRNDLIHNVTNNEILNFHADSEPLTPGYGGSNDYLNEFEIFYYDWNLNPDYTQRPTTYFERDKKLNDDIKKHNGGYKVLDQSGTYYVYGLPTYNIREWETVFSINAAEDNDPAAYMDNNPPVGPSILQEQESIIPIPVKKDNNVPVQDAFGNYILDYEHPNTSKFFSEKETPAYAHAYELTAILGSDYVDVDNNGPSDNDKGYWVKFDYTKYTSDYRWRAPYAGCQYIPGNPATAEDDMGSFKTGIKEIWYLSRIETATHVVIFDLSERHDNYEANGYLNQESNDDANTRGNYSGLKIDRIHLFEKKELENNPTNPTPIQTVHFEYDYSLCPDVPNNDGLPYDHDNDSNTPNKQNEGGKLTLKKVWFTYEKNEKGKLNPYKFEYASNPSFDLESYDRWGGYKPKLPGYLQSNILARDINQNFPYVEQYSQGYFSDQNTSGSGIPKIEDDAQREYYKGVKDYYASAWALSKIKLPSGGEINVKLESDDYAYVQDQRATQMTYITKVNDNSSEKNELYEPGGTSNDFNDPKQRRIYFKLEYPVPTLQTEQWYAQKVYDDYVKDLIMDEGGKRNLYIRSYVKIKNAPTGQMPLYDYVSGYLPLESEFTGTGIYTDDYHYGIDNSITTNIGGTNYYTHGFVTVECTKRKTTGNCYQDFHPFSLLAWQHIRMNIPQLLSDSGDNFATDMLTTGNSNKKKAKKVKNLAGFIPEIVQMATGYRRFCFNKEMAQEILLEKSVIRLTTPDKLKYGGGHRVKEISMTDNWNLFDTNESAETYGQVYDYTTTENVDGSEIQISSGVAQYEPMTGGDEIALRYPRYYPGKVPFKSANNLFYEYPINEIYMPAPFVGYSKVRVTSLNTKDLIDKAPILPSDPEYGRSATGVKEIEFYTAKDYPVIAEETEIKKKNFNVPIIIPFIATYDRNKLGATQGYKIELNDMHGKLKSTAEYGLDDNYQISEDPLSRTKYYYRSNTVMHNGNIVQRLDNFAPTLKVNESTRLYETENRHIGVEYEFFTDQRHNKSANLSIAFNANLDMVVLPFTVIPFPSMWGGINSSKSDLRLHVTNKIIHKAGLLERIESTSENYNSTVENIMYDRESGMPVLNKSSNEYGDEIYKLNHLAHVEYDGMGQASKNINLEFKSTLHVASSTEKLCYSTVPSEILDDLMPGDELIMHVPSSNPIMEGNYYRNGRNYKATFISKNHATGGDGNAIFYVRDFRGAVGSGTSLEAYFKVYRSGRRNHYSAEAGQIVTKEDPLTLQASQTNQYYDELGNLVNANVIYMDKVIDMSAVTFRENWESDVAALDPDNENPYMTGEMGIWRLYKSYIYNGARTQDPNINLSEDGLMNNVPIFKWQAIDFEKFEKDWHYGAEVTRYNDFGYEIENVDRLGIFSSALFGYNKAFAIAIGGNAKYEEIGAEDFERFTVTAQSNNHDVDDTPEVMSLESNLNFYEHRDAQDKIISQQDVYRIIDGSVNGSSAQVVIDKPYDINYWNNVEVDIALIGNLTNGSQDHRLIRVTPIPSDNGNNQTLISFDINPKTINAGLNINYLPSIAELSGKVTVYQTKQITQIDNGSYAAIVDSEAHTGYQSMKMTGTVAFKHGRLNLIAGKEYVLSFWIKKDNSNVPFYNTTNLIQIEDVEGTNQIDLQTNFKTGRVVEGWQKVEVEFTPQTTGNLVQTKFNYLGEAIYVDDIRIAPKTGGVSTYVYDPLNFRLRATLNANNYATYYYYDSEGNMYLTKQETEEGIVTVTESHSFLKDQSSQ